MRIHKDDGGMKIWLSKTDTERWAEHWPGSALSGRRVFAEFDSQGDLVDVVFGGGRGDQDCPEHELMAIIADATKQQEA
jgi:hypothetical protein